MNITENTIFNIVEDIKKDIISTRNVVLQHANRELIEMYFRIGKCISENQNYGSNFINSLSAALKAEFPNTSGYSPRNLSRMKRFYEEYRHLSNLPPAVANLPWTHNYLLLEKVKDEEKRYG